MQHVNVCGLVVHVAPAAADRVSGLLEGLGGIDLHAHDGDRLVVTVIDTTTTQALEQIAAINRIPGVVSTSLAYHQVEEVAPSCGCGPTSPDGTHDCLARP